MNSQHCRPGLLANDRPSGRSRPAPACVTHPPAQPLRAMEFFPPSPIQVHPVSSTRMAPQGAGALAPPLVLQEPPLEFHRLPQAAKTLAPADRQTTLGAVGLRSFQAQQKIH